MGAFHRHLGALANFAHPKDGEGWQLCPHCGRLRLGDGPHAAQWRWVDLATGKVQPEGLGTTRLVDCRGAIVDRRLVEGKPYDDEQLTPVPDVAPAPAPAEASEQHGAEEAPAAPSTVGSLEIWTDGSGTYANGPACIGVVLYADGAILEEVSEYIGDGTNNTAELRAIRRGLYLAATRFGVSVKATLFSDSEYAIGCLTQSWHLRENVKLISAVREQVQAMECLQFVHIDGHAGTYGNELADWLAGQARVKYFTGQGVQKKSRPRPDPDPVAMAEARSLRIPIVKRSRKKGEAA